VVEETIEAVESTASAAAKPPVTSSNASPSETVSKPPSGELSATRADRDTGLATEVANVAARAARGVGQESTVEGYAELVERTGRSAPQTAVGLHPTAADEALPDLPGVDRLAALADDAIGKIAGPIPEPPELSGLAGIILPPRSSTLSPVAGSAPPAAPHLLAMSRQASGSPLTGAVETGVASPPSGVLAASAQGEISGLGAPREPESLSFHRPPAFAPSSAFGQESSVNGPGDRSPGKAPPPTRVPDAPAALAGSSSSFFIPLVALLALLALVAPAIHRRLRAAPDLRAPTPFVCALERPG
jgi:hypothetical protein